ncbi:hypothetical protein [Actinomadura sp. SCN-SB]|uniref:nSTAND1 domain-containing NTPase n=1 Tax=Actinomadura sp. SCN-SB TaxID=3373092 RepID=UPI003753C1B6
MITNSVVKGSPPFVGARPFDIGDDRIFFGRDREIEELSALWRGRRLTLLHGAAGVGKTSLVCAGLMPKLRAEGGRVLPLGHVWRRNVFPTAAFPEQNAFTLALLSSWSPDEPPARVAGLSVLTFLRRHSSKDRFGLPVRTFAAIDQADLLFRGPASGERQRRRFLDQLVEALDEEPDLHLLLVAREEHPEELRALRARMKDGTGTAYALRVFDRSAAVEAVRRPLAARGHEIDAETAGSLVDELRTIRTPRSMTPRRIPAVAPALLQLVCERLWAPLTEEPGLFAERLAANVDQVIADFCGEALATVAAECGVAPARLAAWFRDAFAGPDGTGVTVERARAEMPESVLRAVEDLHLVRLGRRAGTRLYELHHPRMIEPLRSSRDLPGRARSPDASERLRAAERALCEGSTELARYHAEAVIRACAGKDLRLQAEAERLLGNITYEQGRADVAAEHYRESARLFEVLQDARPVGMLLAALGRLLMGHSAAESVRELRTAANRLPNDLVIQTALAQALWQAGQTRGALAMLDAVLTRDGDTLEALRARGEILADLGKAEPALRDLRRVDHQDRPSTRAARMLAEISCRLGGGPQTAAPALRPDGARGTTGDRGGSSVSAAASREDGHDLAAVVEEAAESGPVLLRVARAHMLRGEAEDAAELASRAVTAGCPPLPPHMRDEAYRLRTAGVPDGG